MLGSKTREKRNLGKGDLFGGSPGGGRGKLVAPVLVVCALLAVIVAADYWMNAGKIYRGVEVAGVNLGGETIGAARGAVEERLEGAVGEVRVSGGPEEVTLPAEELGVAYDAGATVERAYEVGRRGNIAERLADRLRAAYGGAEITPEVDYRQEMVVAEIRNLADRVDGSPRDAFVGIEGANVLVFESREGYELDVPATVVNVQNALEDLSGEAEMAGDVLRPGVATPAAEQAAARAEEAVSGPVTLSTGEDEWTLSPEQIGEALDFAPDGEGVIRVGLNQEALRDDLSEVHDSLTVAPVEAGFELRDNRVLVTESRTGESVDEGKLLADLGTGLFEGRREYAVPVVTAEPELTTAEAEALKPTEKLGDYRTDYEIVPDNGDRRENLEIASGAVSGTFLAPGETFSMNDTVSSLDYKPTKVIINGQETKGDGGGLCQVTSTLYMAANYAGLDVTERHPHFSQLPYIRPGLDATVWFGDENGVALDMKFENTTDGYLLLHEYVSDDGYIYAEIYGRPNGVEVEMDSKPTHMGEDYSKWTTLQKVTKDGEVVFNGVLHRDVYEPLVDEKGKTIPPPKVYVPPVRP